MKPTECSEEGCDLGLVMVEGWVGCGKPCHPTGWFGVCRSNHHTFVSADAFVYTEVPRQWFKMTPVSGYRWCSASNDIQSWEEGQDFGCLWCPADNCDRYHGLLFMETQ